MKHKEKCFRSNVNAIYQYPVYKLSIMNLPTFTFINGIRIDLIWNRYNKLLISIKTKNSSCSLMII